MSSDAQWQRCDWRGKEMDDCAQKLTQGIGSDNVEAALCFYKALKVYPQPSDLITIYDKTVPKVSCPIIYEEHKLTPVSACLGCPCRDDCIRPKSPCWTIRWPSFRSRWFRQRYPRCWLGLSGRSGESVIEMPATSKRSKVKKKTTSGTHSPSPRCTSVRATDCTNLDTCIKALPGAVLHVSYLVSNYKLHDLNSETAKAAEYETKTKRSVSFLRCSAVSNMRCLSF